MSDTTDARLVARTREGDLEAFGLLVRRYEGRVRALALHSGLGDRADDAIQDAFVLAHRHLATLREPERFGSWLYTIAGRLCRQRRAERPNDVALVPEAIARPGNERPDVRAERTESRARVRQAVAELPERYRVPIVLRFFDGMNAEQIAGHLGEPPATIRTRLHRASRILREKLRGVGAGQTGVE